MNISILSIERTELRKRVLDHRRQFFGKFRTCCFAIKVSISGPASLLLLQMSPAMTQHRDDSRIPCHLKCQQHCWPTECISAVVEPTIFGLVLFLFPSPFQLCYRGFLSDDQGCRCGLDQFTAILGIRPWNIFRIHPSNRPACQGKLM